MKNLFNIASTLALVLFYALVGVAFGASTPLQVLGAALTGYGAVSAAMPFVSLPKYSLAVIVSPERVSQEIREQMFPDGSWWLRSRDESDDIAQVGGVGVVVRKHENSSSTVYKNNFSANIPVVNSSLEIDQYPILNLKVQPYKLTRADEMSNPQHRAKLFASKAGDLALKIEKQTLVNWTDGLTADRILRTSGAAGVAYHPNGATGDRKLVKYQDLVNMRLRLDDDNLNGNAPVILLISPAMLNEAEREYYANELNGGTMSSFKSWVQEQLRCEILFVNHFKELAFKSDGTGPKTLNDTFGYSTATGDHAFALMYQENLVGRAQGPVVTDIIKAHYGNEMSHETSFGAARVRKDARGVVALVQTT